jgi:iron complex transport system substrate-binding protein
LRQASRQRRRAASAALGAQNIAPQNAGPQPALTTQQIAAANPDVIIVAAGGAGESVSEVAARDGWSGIAAVQANRVFEIGPDLVSRPGPRIVDGLEALARLLYPGKF